MAAPMLVLPVPAEPLIITDEPLKTPPRNISSSASMPVDTRSSEAS